MISFLRKKIELGKLQQTPAIITIFVGTLAPRCIGLARLVLPPGSSSLDCTRCSEIDSDSRYLSNSIGVYEFISLRRANDLRVFMFFELKSVTRGFSKALLIGGGDFGCVYRGVVRVLGLDVAIKQLNHSGFQAWA
ncbi:hypothetical protein CsatA_002439 [Cannabis sativa]